MAKIPTFTENVDAQFGGGLLPQGALQVQPGGETSGFGEGLMALGLLVQKARTAKIDKKILDKRAEAKAWMNETELTANKNNDGTSLEKFEEALVGFRGTYLDDLSGRAEVDARRTIDTLASTMRVTLGIKDAKASATAYKASLKTEEERITADFSTIIAASISETELQNVSERLDNELADLEKAYAAGAGENNGSYINMDAAMSAYRVSANRILTTYAKQMNAQSTPASLGIVEDMLNDKEKLGLLGASIPNIVKELRSARVNLSSESIGLLGLQKQAIVTAGKAATTLDELVELSMGIGNFRDDFTVDDQQGSQQELVNNYVRTNIEGILKDPSIIRKIEAEPVFFGTGIDIKSSVNSALVDRNKTLKSHKDRLSDGLLSAQGKSVSVSDMMMLTVLSLDFKETTLEGDALSTQTTNEVYIDVLKPSVDARMKNPTEPNNRDFLKNVLIAFPNLNGTGFYEEIEAKLKESENDHDLGQAHYEDQMNALRKLIANNGDAEPLNPELHSNTNKQLNSAVDKDPVGSLITGIEIAKQPSGFIPDVVSNELNFRLNQNDFRGLNGILQDIADGNKQNAWQAGGMGKRVFANTDMGRIASLFLNSSDDVNKATILFFDENEQAFEVYKTNYDEVAGVLTSTLPQTASGQLTDSAEQIRLLLAGVLTDNPTNQPLHHDIAAAHAPQLSLFLTMEMTEQNVSNLNEENLLPIYTEAIKNYGTFLDNTHFRIPKVGLVPHTAVNLLQEHQFNGLVADADKVRIEMRDARTHVEAAQSGMAFGTMPIRNVPVEVPDGVVAKTIADVEALMSGVSVRTYRAFVVDASQFEGEGEQLAFPLVDDITGRATGYVVFGFNEDGDPFPIRSLGVTIPGLVSSASQPLVPNIVKGQLPLQVPEFGTKEDLIPAALGISQLERGVLAFKAIEVSVAALENFLGLGTKIRAKSMSGQIEADDLELLYQSLERQYGDMRFELGRESVPQVPDVMRLEHLMTQFVDEGGDINDVEGFENFVKEDFRIQAETRATLEGLTNQQ